MYMRGCEIEQKKDDDGSNILVRHILLRATSIVHWSWDERPDHACCLEILNAETPMIHVYAHG